MKKLPLTDPEKLGPTIIFGWASLGSALVILRCLLGVP